MYNVFVNICENDKSDDICCHGVTFDRAEDGHEFATKIINTLSPDNEVDYVTISQYENFLINTHELHWVVFHADLGIYKLVVENEQRMEEVLSKYGDSSR